MKQIMDIKRPTDIPDEGLLCDLLWSDPDCFIEGWVHSMRGVSYAFGHDIIKKFLRQHDLELICRAHQVVEDGYEFQAERGLVTIFSAPNYCGEFDNAGGMMVVKENLRCSFKILRPESHRPRGYDEHMNKQNSSSSVGPNPSDINGNNGISVDVDSNEHVTMGSGSPGATPLPTHRR